MEADVIDGGCGHEAALLLPWFVTGQLDTAQRVRVESHLAGCAECRADLARQRELRGWLQDDGRVEPAPQASLQKLMSRIDEIEREMPATAVAPVEGSPERPADRSPSARAPVPRWMIAAVVLQAVGLGIFGTLLIARAPSRDDPARFVTLSTPERAADAAPRVRIVFTPQTTTGELAGLLGSEQAEIVAGPTEAGAYTVALRGPAPSPADVSASLARLRANPHVLFAEPAAGATVSAP